MKYKVSILYLAPFILFLNAAALQGRMNIQIVHQAPTIVIQGETVALTFSAPGINPDNIQEAVLYYRLEGDISYKQKRAVLNRSDFTVKLTVPKENAGRLEYYFEIRFNDKAPQTWPLNLQINGPAQIDIVKNRTQKKSTEGAQEAISYTILSPEPGKTVLGNDAVIAITLFYDTATVDTSQVSFRLFLDDRDITDAASANNYFFTYVPDQLAPGAHRVSLKLINNGKSREIAAWDFTATNNFAESNTLTAAFMQPAANDIIKDGRLEFRARNQVIAGQTENIYSGSFNMRWEKNSMRYAVFAKISSQQYARFQPQNRFGLEFYKDDWLEFRVGDFYPFLSPLTIAGRRVRGINTEIRFFDEFLNIEFLFGNLKRGIDNLYGLIEPRLQRFNNTIVDTTYFLGFRENGAGTFRRNIIGGRVAIGRGETFRFGLNLLKIKDDSISIDLIKDYNDVLTMFPQADRNLSPAHLANLRQNPGFLNIEGNPQPKGNVVASADLLLRLHNNNIRFRNNTGVSLLNNNISGGVLDAETAEALGFTLSESTSDLLNWLSWLIIINENMNALPLRFDLDKGGEAQIFFPTSIIASQSELSLHYFDNYLSVRYRWVGPNFSSLANSTIRNDIAGFTVVDRFQLFQNRIYVTLGYGNLRNNVIGGKDATTSTNSYRTNLSWFPVSQELPRVSLGVTYRTRDNEVPLFNPFIAPNLENKAVTNYIQKNGSNVISANPRNEKTIQLNASVSQRFNLLGINHTARLSYTLLNTTDMVFGFGDTHSSSVSLKLINRFTDLPLQTNIGFNYNSTETLSGLGSINILGFNIGGSVFLWDNRLNLDVAFALTQNEVQIIPLGINNNGTPDEPADDYYTANTALKTVRDTQSFVFSASARFNITPRHAILLYSRMSNITGSDESLNLPNDHLLQARYIFSF